MPPSCVKFIKHMQSEIYKLSEERETEVRDVQTPEQTCCIVKVIEQECHELKDCHSCLKSRATGLILWNP